MHYKESKNQAFAKVFYVSKASDGEFRQSFLCQTFMLYSIIDIAYASVA